VESREIGLLDLGAVAPVVAIVVVLGIYPQFVLARSERATTSKLREAARVAQQGSAAPARVEGRATAARDEEFR
jgi:NADH:ubiquinone oxidoreductase subunit 4 (subunit M)